MTDAVLSSRYERKISPVERLFLVGDKLYPPFVSQLVLEGQGEFDLQCWQSAARRVSVTNPGCRLVLRGNLGWSRWVDSAVSPAVHLINGESWNGKDPENAPFLKRPLPARSGPTFEVLLLTGNPNRVIFRTHHGVMDGGGGLRFINEFFRELRGEKSLESTGSYTGLDLARRLGAGRMKIEENDCQSPLPAITIDDSVRDSYWRRITVAGNHSKLLGRIAFVVAQHAHNANRRAVGMTVSGDSKPVKSPVVRLEITTDMRQHCPEDTPTTANLIGLITINVSDTDTVADIINTIVRHRGGDLEGQLESTLAPIRWVPIPVLAYYWRRRTRLACKKNLFASSASLSSIGRLPIENYQGGGFNADTAFVIPPGNSGIPLLITFNSAGQNTEIVAMVPDSGLIHAQLENLLEVLRETLEQNSR